jgi:hypothetical protein
MEKRKVSTFLANEEKKRLLKSGKDKRPPHFLKTRWSFTLNAAVFFKKAVTFFFKRECSINIHLSRLSTEVS